MCASITINSILIIENINMLTYSFNFFKKLAQVEYNSIKLDYSAAYLKLMAESIVTV